MVQGGITEPKEDANKGSLFSDVSSCHTLQKGQVKLA